MLQIKGTKSEIKDVSLTFAECKIYCPFMQHNKVTDCKGLSCNTMDQVYNCGVKYNFFVIEED